MVVYEADGKKQAVRFDTNYSETVALLHPDCWTDAWEGWTVGKIDVKVISPLDLVVSKIGRWEGHDEADVRELAKAGLLDADALEARCKEALDHYIGGTRRVLLNLEDALEAVRKCSCKP